MFRSISLGLVLFAVWLLLSGIFEPLLLVLGVGSCLAVVLIVRRMDVLDREGHPIHLGWRALAYWVWLAREIVTANFDVAKRILDPRLPIDPTIIRVKTSQGSELGQVIYANSITLTPGTVSMRVSEDSILVHALAAPSAAALETGDMDRRVTAMEGGPTADHKAGDPG